MEDKSESIIKQMEDTRSSLTQKLEALEQRVVDTVQPVTSAVEHVSDMAADMVENVKDTVHNVTEKVEETATAISSAFDLRRQTERRPWLVFGVAATAGCMLGSFLGQRARRRRPAQQSSWSRPRHGKGTNGASHASRSAGEPKESWLGEQMEHLKGLAISTLLGVVRDLAKAAVPGALGGRIAQEVESMTTSLGAEPIPGPVLVAEPEPAPPANGASRPSKESTQPADKDLPADKDKPAPEVNRLRPGGAGSNRR